jgi:hypothetical protein
MHMNTLTYQAFCLIAAILAVVFYFCLSERKASNTELAAVWFISRLTCLINVISAWVGALSTLCKRSGSNVLCGSSGARFLMLIVGLVSQSASKKTVQY